MRIKVGFCTSKNWVSRVIRFFTKAPVSHAYIVFDEIPDVVHEVYEAAWCGFRMSTRDKLTSGTTYIVKEIPVGVHPGMALGLCRQWLETPYAYDGLFGEAWVQVGKLFGKRWHNPFPSPHHMFCSEAVVYLLSALGHRAVEGLDARSTDPYMLMQALAAYQESPVPPAKERLP